MNHTQIVQSNFIIYSVNYVALGNIHKLIKMHIAQVKSGHR